MAHRIDYQAASPAGMKAVGGVYGYVMQSGLPQSLVELVYLRVSQINGCAYCVDMHSAELLKRKMPVAKILLVAAWSESGDIFDETERAALAWAERVTRISEGGVPDRDYAAAASVFEAKQLTDLTIAISLMNAYNRIAISFGARPSGAGNQSVREQAA
ncbi:MAG TPA: carboxymuconolactone decarboxylase family protein [Allosphingosinicella sp.]|jgi:AhpD family alkylhydroperoxidase